MTAPMRALAGMLLALACRSAGAADEAGIDVATAAAATATATATAASAPPDATLTLDVERDRVAAELRLPAAELAAALGQPLPASPLPLDGQAWVVVARYLASHLHVRGPDGRAWTVEPGDMRLALDAPAVALAIHADLMPPPGASPRRFALDVDTIGRERPAAATRISLRSDWDGGLLDGGRTLATLRFPLTHLNVDAGPGDAWRGWAAAARLGMRRLAALPGELLFLVTLLAGAVAAAAPANAPGRARTRPARPVRIAAAYVLGHSVTLVAGGIGGMAVPPALLDALAGCALLLAGAHALRALFAGHESRVAAAVGLVHGLACADGLSALRLEPARTVQAVLAFHGGIELVQVATVALALPCLLLAARMPAYRWRRRGAGWSALAAGAAALGGMGAERGVDMGAALSGAVRQPAWLPACALAVLAGMALVGYAGARGRGGPVGAGPARGTRA